MQDLIYLGSDENHIVLRDADGNEYRVIIDEELRRAARGHSHTEHDSTLISPREIQLEIRAGVSVEELVAKTGASLDYVNKFALPVIAELAHIISNALSVRLTMAGDRYSETTQVEFGEVIASRLANIGVVQYEWASRRTENGGWQLHCSFGDSIASWAFDPRKLILTPENELAVQLSSHGTLTDAPLARLRPVSEASAPVAPAAVTPAPATPAPVSQAAPTAPKRTSKPPAEAASETESAIDWPAATESIGSITADLGSTAEFEGVVTFGRSTAAPSEPANDLTNTADLLDELRKKRAIRERELNEAAAIAKEQDQAVEDFSTSIDEFSDEIPSAPDAEPEFAEAADSDSTTPSDDSKTRKGRAAMPSWDEIVFGTRPEDD